jgi:hypothetical protein
MIVIVTEARPSELLLLHVWTLKDAKGASKNS